MIKTKIPNINEKVMKEALQENKIEQISVRVKKGYKNKLERYLFLKRGNITFTEWLNEVIEMLPPV